MNRGDEAGTGAQSVLIALVLVCTVMLTGIGVTVGIGSDAAAAQETSGYTITQNEECRPLQPLGDGSQSVEDFYDYRSPDTTPSGWYETYGDARELLRENTSQVFLYRGSDGLSLVFLNDGVGSAETSGGTAEADLSGTPADGEWVVEDDDYAGQDDDEFDGGHTPHATWAWNEGNRSDGGAYGDLENGDWNEIGIEMTFNDESEKYPYERWNGDPEDNEVTSWIARSGNDVYDLNMDEPVTIARGTCGESAAGNSTTESTGSTGSTGSTDGSDASDGGGYSLPIDVPGVLPSGPIDGWRIDVLAGMSEANPIGVFVLILALFAIALVTLRR